MYSIQYSHPHTTWQSLHGCFTIWTRNSYDSVAGYAARTANHEHSWTDSQAHGSLLRPETLGGLAGVGARVPQTCCKPHEEPMSQGFCSECLHSRLPLRRPPRCRRHRCRPVLTPKMPQAANCLGFRGSRNLHSPGQLHPTPLQLPDFEESEAEGSQQPI